MFDNLDEVDTPEAVDPNIEGSTQNQPSNANPSNESSSLPHGMHTTTPQQSHPFSANYTSGISTPPHGMVSNPPQPLPAHLPIHPHQQAHHHPSSMGVGMSEPTHAQQPTHLPSENVLQNPIDKLYLMQDSYFTQM